MNGMMLKMLADMAGLSPEKLGQEIEGFATLAKESRESLARIETNTQENGAMLRALCAKMEVDISHVGSQRDAGSGSPGS